MSLDNPKFVEMGVALLGALLGASGLTAALFKAFEATLRKTIVAVKVGGEEIQIITNKKATAPGDGLEIVTGADRSVTEDPNSAGSQNDRGKS
jgi:hypothetical protein